MKYFRRLLMVSLLLWPVLMQAQKSAMVPETLWEFGRVGGMQVSPDGKTILFGVNRYSVAENRGYSDLYVIPVEGTATARNITNTSSSEFGAMWRPDGKKIGFLTARSGSLQLWEMNVDGTEAAQVSDIAGGISGFEYSPDMRHIYFIRRVKMEPTVQDVYPDLPMANARIIDDMNYRHWNDWHDYAYSHIFIASYRDGKLGEAYDIMEGEPWDSPLPPYGGIEEIAWTPDGKALAYTSKKLKGKDWAVSTNSDIYLYQLETRQTRNLTAFNEGYDRNPVFSPDGKFMAWESMATPGFESDKNRIMIMDMATGQVKDYSAGFDQSSDHFIWSKDAKTLYFRSGIHATYQLYSLDMKSGKISQITKGTHNYSSVALAGRFLVGEQMSMSMPTEIFRIDLRRGEQVQLTRINDDILNRIEMGRVEERWVKTTDNKDMLVWVIYPPGFDPNKKYPALLYCGGGPQSAVSQFFSYRWNFQIMAAHDYIVIAPNRRGLPTFGQEWNDQISQDYGGQNMKDYISAVNAIKTEPFVDEKRIGAVGASYGGFSVYWLAGNHKGLFNAFIAHCGMFNFESWYGTTEEMFFANHDLGGPYWSKERPHSYDFSPHRFVGNWDTPILVIHGAKDFRVPYSEGMQAFNAAKLQGIPSRFLYFPEETHYVLRPQNSVLWQREFFRWLDHWLK